MRSLEASPEDLAGISKSHQCTSWLGSMRSECRNGDQVCGVCNVTVRAVQNTYYMKKKKDLNIDHAVQQCYLTAAALEL
jgi:hypothetical protein